MHQKLIMKSIFNQTLAKQSKQSNPRLKLFTFTEPITGDSNKVTKVAKNVAVNVCVSCVCVSVCECVRFISARAKSGGLNGRFLCALFCDPLAAGRHICTFWTLKATPFAAFFCALSGGCAAN